VGHEQATRPTIDAIERDGAWVARAFANRRPALVVEASLRADVDGPYERVSGVGAHEVIVESPEHHPLHTQAPERTATALALAARRLRDLRGDRRLRTLLWLRNHGAAAGASQPHPHAQILGLPLVPTQVRALVERSRRWAREHDGTLQAAVVEAERRDGRRLIADHDGVVTFCPWAPSQPFEVWVVPTGAGRHLADASDEVLGVVATHLCRALRALDTALGPVAYNAVALGPPEEEGVDSVSWHLRVTPRLVTGGGLEVGAGASMHGVFPEESARVLRAAVEASSHPVP
jgi:UDPglucose--hexose-1-phosphate uridylyltransferase